MLVGWFGFCRPFRWYFSLYQVSPREREKEKLELIGEKKMSTQPPPAPTASTVSPRALLLSKLPYFFGYKTEIFFSSKTIPKNLDLSYKTDLDLLDCLGRVKLVFNIAKFMGLIQFFSHSREENPIL